jgi:hypothetical protein
VLALLGCVETSHDAVRIAGEVGEDMAHTPTGQAAWAPHRPFVEADHGLVEALMSTTNLLDVRSGSRHPRTVRATSNASK